MALIGYALVASGLPLPLGAASPAAPNSPAAKRLAGKDRSRPFPCMDKPCGCATAEQCFSNCCCNPRPAKPACCAGAAEVSCCESSAPEPDEPEDGAVSAHTVVLRAMLACGGIVAEWLAVGAALPPPPVVTCERAAEPIASLILVNEVSLSERAAPDGPPPRST